MNACTFNLTIARNNMATCIELFNNLLDNLENEAKNYDGWALKQFNERFVVLTQLIDAVVEYDKNVQLYIQLHPDTQNVQYYHDKLAVAKKYIQANGLDWSAVTWGKLNDYR